MVQPAPGQDKPGIMEFLFNNCFRTKQSLEVDEMYCVALPHIPLQIVFFIAHGQDLVHFLIAKPLQQWSQSVTLSSRVAFSSRSNAIQTYKDMSYFPAKLLKFSWAFLKTSFLKSSSSFAAAFKCKCARVTFDLQYSLQVISFIKENIFNQFVRS